MGRGALHVGHHGGVGRGHGVDVYHDIQRGFVVRHKNAGTRPVSDVDRIAPVGAGIADGCGDRCSEIGVVAERRRRVR